jgi:hypothetical protein
VEGSCKYNYNDQVQEDETGRACSTHGKPEECVHSLVGKPEGKRPLGRPIRGWEDNVKIDLREIEWGDVD